MNLMKALDCFCGKGGVSDGFALEGFDVTGTDIVDAPTLLNYKHRFILADMLTLKGEDFKGFDVIWGSPPCRDFSKMASVGFGSKKNGSEGKYAWKVPPDPLRGLELVNAYLRFIKRAQSQIWIMENVPGLIPYIEEKPIQISYIAPTKKRAFWGNYPSFLMPLQEQLNIAKSVRGKACCIQGKYRSWERAKIPVVCSRAFAKACREKLENI